ncbi:hypothetical protein [Spirosoma flavum]|uniref:Uncharacterized protein n=1 Tax=Spirosoma flavum TaxID=2048557 RepID=A0ABW6AG82_9BACT
MFGLDPFNRPVAIIEMLILLALAAFIGWLLGRLVLAGRVRALHTSIADKEVELATCRQSKISRRTAVVVPPASFRSEPVVDVPPAFVHADPLLPAFSNDDTPELIDEEVIAPISSIERRPTFSIAGVDSGNNDNSEAAVLSRIAARANEVNFDRIGRAVASEADDLKDIVGVGPFLERKLHSLGIYTFRQVANFTKEDIDKVNELIEFFPGRIERDTWVEQSKEFYERKYGQKS